MSNPNRYLLGALVYLTLMLFLSAPLRATWYGENIEKGSDIMMMDIRWPWWAESTYFANWNFTTAPSGIGGYGGFAGHAASIEGEHRPNLDPHVQDDVRPGSVWSFWGSNREGEPVRVAASSEYTYPRQYIGEGASGALAGPVWPFVRDNRWYTMMMRVWEPAGVDHPQYSYIGRWIKDVEAGQWHLYGIMRLPVPATSFNNNAGFLEDFANSGRSVRSLHRRLGYCRKDGKWYKSDTVTYDVPPKKGQLDTYWVVNICPESDHEFLAMELSCNPALLPQKLHGKTLALGRKHSFTVKQPELPTLDQPAVKDVLAQSNGKQVFVSWTIPVTASPQFAYRVEIFDNRECRGQPLAVRDERMPTVRAVLLPAAVSRPTVRLSIIDVFDQPTPPVVVAATPAPPAAPPTTCASQPGLEYELLIHDSLKDKNFFYPGKTANGHSEQHHWLTLTELKDGRRLRSGVTQGFDTTLCEDRQEGYAFRFRGLLRVAIGGLYLLHMQGADGYRIALDGQDALVWDGPHGPAEKTAMVSLAKGDHPLAVDYFVDRAPVPYFKLEWEGPGVPRQEIPTGLLLHAEAGSQPRIALAATGAADGTAHIAADVAASGHSIDNIQLFLGKRQLAAAAGSRLAYDGLMPAGDSLVWARVTYDHDHTFDSESKPVSVQGPEIRGWDVGIAGEAKAQHGLWQTPSGSLAFFGDGEFVVSRKTIGDFVLTCRIDSFGGSRGEPVNALSWVGLTAREHGNKGLGQWGREFGLMQTSRAGVRTTPNHYDLAGGRVSTYTLPAVPWLRVVRRGNQWTAWTSADGRVWTLGATHFIPNASAMDAGVVFRALPQDARAYFHAQVSHISLEPGSAKDVVMPAPAAAKNTGGARLTGVVMAQCEPDVVVLRSSDRGLLRSIDGGASWAPANGGLNGAANCVRSVAIHPIDARIILRAAGHADSHGNFEGGLMLTRDGGQTWKSLDFPGDFDGDGPSALCGEVVAFDPVTPEIRFAGCETKGFFRSGDGGKTWKRIGADGERVTAVSVNHWVRGKDNQAYLHIVTCPDAWMPLLGRGRPVLSARVRSACDYISRDGGLSLERICQRTDLGYLNVAFDKGSRDQLPYATTHGVLFGMSDGRETFFSPATPYLDCLRPVTGLACAGVDESRTGRCLTLPLSPTLPGQLSRSDFYTLSWTRQAGCLRNGLIAACGELQNGRRWWLLSTDGLYRTLDGGSTLKKVLDNCGNTARRSP